MSIETGTPQERIVTFAADLLDGCAALFRTAFNEPPWNDTWTPETARRRLAEMRGAPNFFGLVTLRDGAPAALVAGDIEHWCDRTVYYMKEMCVRNDLQGRGIGTRLLQHLEAALRDRSVSDVFLISMRGSGAQVFYAHNGYHVVRDSIMMTRALGE